MGISQNSKISMGKKFPANIYLFKVNERNIIKRC